MPRIPAVCNRCGAVRLSGVTVKDCTCHIKDYVEGGCECGGSMIVLDGTYSHLGGPLNYCRAPEADQLRFQEMCRQCGIELYLP